VLILLHHHSIMARVGNNTLVALNRIIEGNEFTYLGSRTCEFDASMTERIRMGRPPVLVHPRPLPTFQLDSDIETAETTSVSSSERDGRIFPLEYRITGLVWYTAGLTNTCNVDSFLSAWVRRVRQTHGRCASQVVTTDIPGNALIKIADYAMSSGERVDAKTIKVMWYSAVLESTGEADALRRPLLDCVGVSVCSVFQHLKHHSSYAVVSRCLCDTVFHRDFFFEIPSLDELRFLGNRDSFHLARTPKCLRCNQKRQLIQLLPDYYNWLLPIVYNGTGDNRSPSLSRVPRHFKLNRINFKLGYVSYSQLVPGTRMNHEVSLQFIRGAWYLYDGLRTPKFKLWEADSYNIGHARMSALVYFRVLDEDD
jgi:hypothetical protein